MSATMSTSSVRFLNIKNVEIDLNVHNKISVEYVVDDGVQVSSSDWIALFPFGCDFWNSVNLDLMVAFEFVLSRKINKERRYNTQFSLKTAKNLKYSLKYQFVYISRYSDIYGISKTFEFRPPVMKIIPEETNVNDEASDDSSKENTESNTLKPNVKRRMGKLPALQSVEVRMEKRILDTTMRGEEDQIDAKKFVDKFNRNKQIFVKKQLNWQNCDDQHTSPAPCSDCHRGAELQKAQLELYNKIKNIAEINAELRKQVGLVQHQLELSLAARQKVNVTLMRERHARLFYQNLAYELAQQNCQTVVVEPLSASSRLCDKKTKVGYSALKLKAIIGNQEEKIRRLRKEIEQLKMGREGMRLD